MSRHLFAGAVAALACVAVPTVAGAQSTDFSQAVLSLPSQSIGDSRLFDSARLFGGLVQALIINQSGSVDDFEGADQISFQLVPRNGTTPPDGVGFASPFQGTRAEFEQWASDNAATLLAVLFPGGLSAGAAGRDISGLYSQQLMLTTILNIDDTQPRARLGDGGLFETEWLRRDVRQAGDSAWAIQGLYGFSPTLSLHARYARQQEALQTTATNAAVDYHPFIEYGSTTRVRVGASARAGFLYSSSRSVAALDDDPIRFGSIDVAGGGWASVRRRFSRVTVGGGGLLQGTKSHIPRGEEGTFRAAFADSLNQRGIAYDLTLGATARFDATNTVSVIGRVAETYGLESSVDRPTMHMMLGGVMFALAPGASLDAGYKATVFAGTLAQSIFFQGSFGW